MKTRCARRVRHDHVGEDVQPTGQKVTVSPLGHHKPFQTLGQGFLKPFSKMFIKSLPGIPET